MEFDCEVLSEPFFFQTIERLRTRVPPADEQVTSIDELALVARDLPEYQPAGVIFHVSRCGSTLVSNTTQLVEGFGVLSEAQPVAGLFQPDLDHYSSGSETWEEVRRRLIDYVVRLYAHHVGGNLLIKTNTIAMLEVETYRSVWPETPFLIVVRDPVEVIVSNMARPAGWVKSKASALFAPAICGVMHPAAKHMQIEEYCARSLGRFCTVALDAIDSRCRVIDYSSLGVEGLAEAVTMFGIHLPATDSTDMRRFMAAYSKDPAKARAFGYDSEQKQLEATDAMRKAAARWAREPYDALRALEIKPAKVDGNGARGSRAICC